MKNLTIYQVKNETLKTLSCTPNTVILAKQTISERNGDITTSVKYIEVCQIEKTDPLAIVKALLKYCVAEYFVCKEFETDFADTNIKQRKIFNQFLNTNIIYRTNSEGKIASALLSEVPLSQTALKVTNKHTITNCKKENLKTAIYQHSKAILSQCKHLSMIVDKAKKLSTDFDADIEAKVTETKAVETKKRTRTVNKAKATPTTVKTAKVAKTPAVTKVATTPTAPTVPVVAPKVVETQAV